MIRDVICILGGAGTEREYILILCLRVIGGLYMVDVSNIRFAYSETTGSKLKYRASGNKIRIVYLMTSCRKSGPTQVIMNILKYLDQSIFEPILITIYDEYKSTCLTDVLPYVSAHYMVKTGKKDVLLGRISALRKKLEELNPDVIYSTGVFPMYAVAKISPKKQIITLHCNMYVDYPMKFGKIRGTILAFMQLYAMKRSTKAIACSRSLRDIYRDRLGLNFDFICNGVDLNQYTLPTESEKRNLREKLGLPLNAFIYVCVGSLIAIKNVPFLVESYASAFGSDEAVYLLLLGDGPDRKILEERYADNHQIDFRGNVRNVSEFLKACDVYVSSSKSEGLPKSVMEAMATGLPVVLSDIEQHKEFFEGDAKIGYLYKQGDSADMIEKLRLIFGKGAAEAGRIAYEVVRERFNAEKMSLQYQEVYRKVAGR